MDGGSIAQSVDRSLPSQNSWFVSIFLAERVRPCGPILGYDFADRPVSPKGDLMNSMFSTLLLLTCLQVPAIESIDSPADDAQWKTPDLKITAIPEHLSAFTGAFDRYTSVFGVHLFATKSFSDAKLIHVAAVLAEYLDNDEDGVPDNPQVVEAMASRQMGMVLFGSEREMERLDGSTIESLGYRNLQGQFAEETRPERGFDATLEEVLHLVTVGYCEAYPRVFGAMPDTQLGDCLDRARGGRFARVPRRYPEESWFHYDDRSCDYSCMAVEYLYWALTSLLGAQDDPQRSREIRHEWELTSEELVRKKDPWITSLLEDPGYHWASRLPDGKYRQKEKKETKVGKVQEGLR